MQPRAAGTKFANPILLGMWGLAVLGCFIGLGLGPVAGAHPTVAQQVEDLIRTLTTTALAVVLVLGPGLALRARQRERRVDLGFVPLPGLALLVVTGCVTWALAKDVDPRVTCALVAATTLVWIIASIRGRERDALVTSEELRVLLVVGAALGVAIARTLWSLSPPGEWGAGTIERALEMDRGDSAISFSVVQLVTHGASPFGALARSYFWPYGFSDRGPLAGLASVPVVLMSGGRPPQGAVSAPWSPFDPQGFMAYRLAMMTFASTAFLSIWTLVRRLAGNQAARFAVLLCATTPFLVHEIWYTWPKLLAASLVLLAAVSLIDRRFLLAGLLAGVGYLVHPLALLSTPTLVLIALWPLTGARAAGQWIGRAKGLAARVPRPRFSAAVVLLSGLAVSPIAWRLVNWSHYTQSGFLSYVGQAGWKSSIDAALVRALGGHPSPVTLSAWLSDRFVSVANTVIPLRLFFFSANDPGINTINHACFPFCAGHSPAIVHFFYQYWTGVPFGLAIVFFPLLLASVWRALRSWPWAVTATVIVPFLVFAVYWGGISTGLLREGLHVWVLTLIAVVAIQQKHSGFPWLRSVPVRALLAVRAAEVLLVAMLPTLVTRARLSQPQFRLTDLVSVLGMVTLTGWLARAVWGERLPREQGDQRQEFKVRPRPDATLAS